MVLLRYGHEQYTHSGLYGAEMTVDVEAHFLPIRKQLVRPAWTTWPAANVKIPLRHAYLSDGGYRPPPSTDEFGRYAAHSQGFPEPIPSGG